MIFLWKDVFVTESKLSVSDGRRRKQLLMVALYPRWQHHFPVPTTIPDSSTLAMWPHFLQGVEPGHEVLTGFTFSTPSTVSFTFWSRVFLFTFGFLKKQPIDHTGVLQTATRHNLRYLAHLVISLCNHALSVVWCGHCCHWHQHRHLCTALPVAALIIETSYLANICSYTPSICTWNIRSMWHIFVKGQPF